MHASVVANWTLPTRLGGSFCSELVGAKHAPIELGKYLEIHETAMRSLERDKSYVLPGGDGLGIERVDTTLLIAGRIQCSGGILIDVRKVLAILEGEGDTAIVQTVSYTYHALAEDIGSVLRYCSPHTDHNFFHHKHTFDALNGDVHGHVTEIETDKWPTLSEVICEVCKWYYDNATAIEAMRASSK